MRPSWCTGDGSEAPADIARKLLRRSRERGALDFDSVADDGPFEITLADICEERTRYIQTSQVSNPPARICQYCRHLKKPEGWCAKMARAYDCGKGNWDDSVRRRDAAGRSNPNLEFSCDEFEAEFKTWKQVYYV